MPDDGLFVSIIIPTLNSAATLTDCLNSIFSQDYARDRLEVIIADGGSSDETLGAPPTGLYHHPWDVRIRISRGVASPEAAGAVELETVRNATAMLDYLKRV